MKIRSPLLFAILALGSLTLPLHAQVPQIISYQGRVVANGTNFNGTGQFKFALVNAAGNVTYWSNNNSSTTGSEPSAAVSLSVTNGLYSVLLGDTSLANMTAIPATVFSHSDVRLRVWFNNGTNGSQLLTPDQRIASVGFAMNSAAAANADLFDGLDSAAFLQKAGGSLTGDLTLSASSDLNFGTQTRQMLNLWSTQYGIGVQTDTQYFRSNNNFAWYRGGVHNDGSINNGGGSTLMSLTPTGLSVSGNISSGAISAVSGTDSAIVAVSPGQVIHASTDLFGPGGSNTAAVILADTTHGTGILGSTVDMDGVVGLKTTSGKSRPDKAGVYGESQTDGGNGVIGVATNGASAYGVWGYAPQGRAGRFDGKVDIAGGLSILGAANTFAAAGPINASSSLTVAGLTTANGGLTISAPSTLAFGSQARQMISLYNNGTDTYAIGVQSNTLYERSGNGFAWFKDGVHSNTTYDPGAGGTHLMRLDGNGQFHVGGGVFAGVSLEDRAANVAYTSAPANGERWETYVNTGVYRLWSGSDKVTLDKDGVMRIVPATGRLETPVLTVTGGSDLAEPFPITHPKGPHDVEPGTVLVIDEANPGQLIMSTGAYDTRVAGVVSGAGGVRPGLTMRQKGVLEGDENVALTGRVYVKACNDNGAIAPGDLLTTSNVPGYAQKVTDHTLAQGAILGKAMTPLTNEQGLVLVLVTLQ